MKILLLNGSPHQHGCTNAALEQLASELTAQGVDSQIVWVGSAPVGGCMGCGKCRATGGQCVLGDGVNQVANLLDGVDGLVVGSPVHYAAASGNLTSFLDRLFYSSGARLKYKVGASIACARRAGTTATLDQLNKYFTISSMLLVGSQYWNMVHGNSPEEVAQDAEGMQTMRQLARNLAWAGKCLQAGKQAGIALPAEEAKVRTNFIR